ncbi:MAG TPA: response regulator [Burkholderiales bacterium]|nr:response regulator [Burkholderiales bacterium]
MTRPAPERVQILLVEDKAGEAESSLRVLRESRAAHQVHWVKDGEEALDFLFCSGRYAGRDPGAPPAIVLLDIKLPKIDGIEVLRRVKGSQLRAIPVVVMTSSTEERDVLESYRLGVDRYVAKPLALEGFLDAIKGLL